MLSPTFGTVYYKYRQRLNFIFEAKQLFGQYLNCHKNLSKLLGLPPYTYLILQLYNINALIKWACFKHIILFLYINCPKYWKHCKFKSMTPLNENCLTQAQFKRSLIRAALKIPVEYPEKVKAILYWIAHYIMMFESVLMQWKNISV
jgi:hypothetical protein